MRVIKSILFVALIAFLGCTNATAQPNPAMSTKHSNAEIIKLIFESKNVQDIDIMPSSLLVQKLMADFPGAYDIEWENSNNIFNVEFEIKGIDYKAYYTEQGDLLMYRYDLRASELPAAVKDVTRADYPRYRIESSKKIVRGSEIYYNVDLERGEEEIEISFTPQGTVAEYIFD